MDRQSLLGLNHYQIKNDVVVAETPTVQKATEVVCEILSKYSDSKTALFLSGFVAPKLYEEMVKKDNLKAGAVLQTEEFYNEKYHKNSRKQLIKSTGILDYFDEKNVRFYPLIQENKDLTVDQNAQDYDEALRFIFKYFPKNIGILTIDKDFQTAGILSDPMVVKKMMSDQSKLVSFDNGMVTLNFNALGVLDLIILVVVGQDKREALSSLFKISGDDLENEIEKQPARFFLRPEIAKKTIIVTDQMF